MTAAGPAGASLLGGRYELLTLLASGGMGQVWRGRDVLLQRPVAVKVLRSEFTGNATFLARFRAEAQHTAVLTHPNIAALFDYGETSSDDGEHLAYLVMELVEGESLAQLLDRNGRLGAARTLDVLEQAAAGLAAAHTAGLVHRDVKPGNVLVGADGTVKITDFGIAWSAGSAPLTQTGQVIGTAHYLAPEQAAGEKAGPASDVYALGMIAYECLAGHRAFDGENSVQIALRHLREVPAPLPGDVPEPVRTLVDRALLKDPSARYPDGAAFRDAIGDVRAGRPLAPAPVAAGTRPFPAVGHQPRRSLRRRLVAPLAALVAGVGLGVGALQAWGDAPAGSVAQAVAGAEIVPSVVVDAADLVGRPVDAVEAELVGRGLGVQRAARETSGVTAGLVTEVGPVGTVTPGTVITLTYAVAPPAPPAGASSAAPVPSSAPVRAPAPVPVPVPVPAPVPVPVPAPVPAPAPAVAVEAPVVAVEAPDTGANDDHPTAGGENGAARRNGDGDAPGQGNGNGGPGGNGQGNGPGKGNGNGRGG